MTEDQKKEKEEAEKQAAALKKYKQLERKAKNGLRVRANDLWFNFYLNKEIIERYDKPHHNRFTAWVKQENENADIQGEEADLVDIRA